MSISEKMRKRTGDVTVKIPYCHSYRRYGEKIEKTIQIPYAIPREIVLDGELDELKLSQEMAKVIYEAETNMETARKRVSELKIGCYVEGLTETEMAHRVDEVFEQVEQRLIVEEVRKALDCLKPLQRQRVILYHFYGCNTCEIAEAEGTYQSNVYRSIKSAEKKLKKHFEKML